MKSTNENDYYQSLFDNQQEEYQTLGEQYEDEIEGLIEKFRYQEAEHQVLAEKQENENQSLIEEFQQQEAYKALIELQENEFEAILELMQQQEEQFEALIEQQEAIADAFIEQYETQLYLANRDFSIPEKASDIWFIIKEDFAIEQSNDEPSLDGNNFLFTIHKKMVRKSKSGKTPYFSYHILDKNLVEVNLKIGNYYCIDSDIEHWVSWEFDNDLIEKKHFIRAEQLKKKEFYNNKNLIFPIEYTFATLVHLDKYNPFNFNFNRLNFLKQDSKTTSGDKLSRIKIFGPNNQFLVLSIFNFENNIINLLKQLNDSTSFSEFLLKSHLTLAVKYLLHMQKSNFGKSNFPMFKSYLSIIEHIENVIDENYKFLNKDIKENKESNINTLLSSYNNLKKKLDSLNN